MSSWREKIAQFMQGRYGGNDTLNKWLLGAFLLFLVLSLLLGSEICNLLAIAALIYSYFRIFSRNISRRTAENQKFYEWTQPIRNIFSRKSNTSHDAAHRIFQCPNCGQKVRVPKGRGKIQITCPKCRHEFQKRS